MILAIRGYVWGSLLPRRATLFKEPNDRVETNPILESIEHVLASVWTCRPFQRTSRTCSQTESTPPPRTGTVASNVLAWFKARLICLHHLAVHWFILASPKVQRFFVTCNACYNEWMQSHLIYMCVHITYTHRYTHHDVLLTMSCCTHPCGCFMHFLWIDRCCCTIRLSNSLRTFSEKCCVGLHMCDMLFAQ